MVGDAQPEITGSDAGHICRVLRLSTGDTVELFDGTGKGYRARIVSLSPKRVVLEIEETFALLSESPVQLTLAQAMLKDRKMDDLLRPLTELGINGWIPFYAARSVPVASAKGLGARLARWEKISREAVKQCRRGCMPQITPMKDLDAVLATAGEYDLKIIFWEETPRPFVPPEKTARPPQRILILVGPEGGFDADEVRRARANGFLTAGLGPRILRAETAAVAACTLVQYCFGDMGGVVKR
ncbi:16S rRNA (uracil(1498)-N(3))-methyltransferase [Desulfosarcina cetonica]